MSLQILNKAKGGMATMSKLLSLTLGLAVSFAGTALAQEVTIGVTLGATGPGASLGVHYKNAFQLMPKTVGGLPVKFIILEDNSDPTVAAKNARRLIAEDKVDAIMGMVSVPSTTQVALIGNEKENTCNRVITGGIATEQSRMDFYWCFVARFL